MDEVVSVQIILRHHTFSFHSSLAVEMEGYGKDRVWTTEDKKGIMSISGSPNSLLLCWRTPSGGNPGKTALFCIPCGPMNSVSWDDGMWLRVFFQSYKDRPNYSHKLLESTVLMTLSCPLAAPHPSPSCSVLPAFSEDFPPLILDSSGPGCPAPELLSFLPSLHFHINGPEFSVICQWSDTRSALVSCVCC